MNDTEAAEAQQFKQVIHHTCGDICKEIQQETGVVFSKHAVATLAEICNRQVSLFAEDLEAFTKHARRKKISAEDVLMLARKTTSLHQHLESMKQ